MLIPLCTQITIPTITKAIGANNMNPLLTYPVAYKPVFSTEFPRIYIPNNFPEPFISLNNATTNKMIQYPKPLPKPSKKEGHGLFPKANASKRPIKIQFVIINPTNTDNCLLIS